MTFVAKEKRRSRCESVAIGNKSFHDLPDEVLLHILALVTSKISAIATLSTVCKRWKRLCKHVTLGAFHVPQELAHKSRLCHTFLTKWWPNVRHLDVSRRSLTSLRFLEHLGPQSLNIHGIVLSYNQLNDSCLEPLTQMRNLKYLCLEGTGITNIAPIACCVSLHTLDLTALRIRDISCLTGLKCLQRLTMSATLIEDVTAVANFPRLQLLKISSTEVTDISPLAKCTQLRTLIMRSTAVKDLSPIAHMKTLRCLDVSYCARVEDISSVAHCNQLETLIARNTRISDISCLSSASKLVSLSIGNTFVTDISVVKKLKKLRYVFFLHTPVSNTQVLDECHWLQCAISSSV
eukprot:Colp12_sorted_trinity150504_noHs@9064